MTLPLIYLLLNFQHLSFLWMRSNRAFSCIKELSSSNLSLEFFVYCLHFSQVLVLLSELSKFCRDDWLKVALFFMWIWSLGNKICVCTVFVEYRFMISNGTRRVFVLNRVRNSIFLRIRKRWGSRLTCYLTPIIMQSKSPLITSNCGQFIRFLRLLFCNFIRRVLLYTSVTVMHKVHIYTILLQLN